ncbi:MAG: deoxyribonuclease IV [Candidatus Buchananbacteria bacterium]|nr:deoxyribonuclease IV [Candidatus Buchananbacteria bacterium]
MKFGLHVSIAGGIFNAPVNAAEKNCEVFQMFTRSPRGGQAPSLTAEVVREFKENCQKNKFKNYYVHTPYYINYASVNNRIAFGSAQVVRQELERSSQLGVKALMTHLGSGKDFDQKTARQKVVEGLLKTLDGYKGTTQFLIEIAAGAGLILGASFEEIAFYINEVEKKDKRLKNKIGVCLDTCHMFACGYDLRNKIAVKKTFKDFDRIIGLKRLVLIHANDSKTEFGSHKDRHEHIGDGQIGKDGFAAIVKLAKLKNVDLILETPHDGKEIRDLKLLKSFRD